MRIVPPDWTFANIAFAAVLTFVNAIIWRRTARWMLSIPTGDGKTRNIDMLQPSWQAQQTAAREPVSPLRQMYNDARRLAAYQKEHPGKRMTRRRAQRERGWKWSAGQWNRAYWFCKQAGVFNEDGELIIDYWNDVEILLEEFRFKAAELKRSPNFVFPR